MLHFKFIITSYIVLELMKKLFLYCTLFFSLINLSVPLFANDGVLSGTGKLFVSQTKWFDIIYPEECIQSAKIIAENADSLYEEISADYSVKPYLRMPVVITPSVEQFNAYWSNYPYNHIVVYDTCSISDLQVFTETIKSTFRHELTHAVTYNLKNPFFKTLSMIFGDPISVSWWMTSQGMAEGATLTSESKYGEGRLNSDFALHDVKQAKIENAFPDYYDIQGGTDIYPLGAFYIFGGTFNSWLCNKYGKEKYAQLWYKSINMGAIDIKSAFYKVYGLDLKKTWSQFIDEFEIPKGINPDPINQGVAEDFFTNGKNHSRENNSGSVYESLTSCPYGVSYIDDTSDTVFFASSEQLKKLTNKQNSFSIHLKPKKLFTLRNITSIKYSADGKFIVASYYSKSKGTIKKGVKIYNVEADKLIDTKLSSVDSPAIVISNGKYYLVYQKFESQNYTLCSEFLNFSADYKTLLEMTPCASLAFDYGIYCTGLTEYDDGQIAFVQNKGLERAICTTDLYFNNSEAYKIPGNEIRDIFAYNGDLYFSWTKKGTLPRMGKLNLTDKTFTLQTEDYSGGIFNPVICGNYIYYIGRFWRQTRLLRICRDLNVEYEQSQRTVLYTKSQNDQNSLKNKELVLWHEQSKSYNPFNYYKKGFLVPFAQLTSRNYNLDNYGESYSIPFGITYYTSNPWNGNSLFASAGYGIETKSFAFQFGYLGYTDTNIFNYEVNASTEFDFDGFKKVSGVLQTQSIIPFGNYSNIILRDSLTTDFGRSLATDSPDTPDYFYAGFDLQFTVSSVHSSGPGRYEKSGISFTTLYSYDFCTDVSDFSNPEYNTQNVGFVIDAYIPKLIPIVTDKNFVYNLPTKLEFNLFAVTDEYSNSAIGDFSLPIDITSTIPLYDLMGIKAETVLFGYEIQHAIPGVLWLVANECRISFIYSGGFVQDASFAGDSMKILNITKCFHKIQEKDLQYDDYAGLRFVLGLTTNFGSPAKADISFTICLNHLRSDITPVWGLCFDTQF